MKTSLLDKFLLVATVVLVLAVVVVVVARTWPLSDQEIIAEATIGENCDLQTAACSAEFAGGIRLRFSISPRPIPLIEPIELRVEVEGLDAEAVMVDIQGLNYNMGFNRPKLNAVGERSFVGSSILPVCSLYKMDWEARVLVATAKGIYAAPFRFFTVRQAESAKNNILHGTARGTQDDSGHG